MEKILIDEQLFLSPVIPADAKACIKVLKDRDISDNTFVSYPYLEEDFEWFLTFCKEKDTKFGRTMNWAIRKDDGELIGSIGFHGKYSIGSHREEIGYWLAKPYWNKGIMSKALRSCCALGFDEYGYVRIEAPIFAFNTASQRVAEKCGFAFEGVLKKAYLKDEKYIDAVMYALVK